MNSLPNQHKIHKIRIEEQPDFWPNLPEYVKAGVEKSLGQVKSGQTKSFEEVKKIIRNR